MISPQSHSKIIQSFKNHPANIASTHKQCYALTLSIFYDLNGVSFMFSRVHLACAAAACLLVTACVEKPNYDFSVPSFAGQKQFELNVQNIAVESDYTPNPEEASLLRHFPITPLDAINTWSRERLWAVGSTNRAVVHVIDASVKRVPKPESSHSELDRYRAHLSIEVNIYSAEKASPVASVNTEIEITDEIFNDASDNAHRAFFADITRRLMKKMDENLTTSMNNYFQTFLAYGNGAANTGTQTQTIMPSAPIQTTTVAPAPTISAEPYAPSSPEPRSIGTLTSDKPF
jgi:hypothetical protein